MATSINYLVARNKYNKQDAGLPSYDILQVKRRLDFIYDYFAKYAPVNVYIDCSN